MPEVKRKPGFYWVKPKGSWPNTVAKWFEVGCWLLPGFPDKVKDEEIVVLSDRLLPPKEKKK